ncbi:MAG TPA: gliding motility-associated ABC transporter ATP-binding subunit GldA [Lentimicrobium sp.]|nr:gliding motility-associated ABC transporter ATP-binding subunit GldA [Lentimicrobium sp.]
MSIVVSNITKRYGNQLALDNVSFSIKPGEIVGLLGPNGAGKSTLMKIITCFIPPTSGDVTVYGFDIREQSLEIRKKVGYLPENNPLYTEMYIRESLEFMAGLHNLGVNTNKRVNDIMELTGLNAEKSKKIGALSKGYRQRVGLAQALIHDPDVLILDEPTSGLDPNQLVDIRNLIIEIGKQKTVVLSTHIMQEVEAMCNRAIIINQGKIVADDSPRNLLDAMGTSDRVIVEFDQAVDIKTLKLIKGVKQVFKKESNTWIFESEKNIDIRQEIFQFAVAGKLTVLSMQKEESSLEGVFQKLTRLK